MEGGEVKYSRGKQACGFFCSLGSSDGKEGKGKVCRESVAESCRAVCDPFIDVLCLSLLSELNYFWLLINFSCFHFPACFRSTQPVRVRSRNKYFIHVSGFQLFGLDRKMFGKTIHDPHRMKNLSSTFTFALLKWSEIVGWTDVKFGFKHLSLLTISSTFYSVQ